MHTPRRFHGLEYGPAPVSVHADSVSFMTEPADGELAFVWAEADVVTSARRMVVVFDAAQPPVTPRDVAR